MKSIAVFCASAKGNDPIYMQTAEAVGKAIAKRKFTLVYGGASVGLMGAVAKGALSEGGKVIGVLPHFLDKREIAQKDITLIKVDSMHERKLKMNELSDACLTIPGGFGTMEEFFEMITWAQLGLHEKPNGLLNVNGYYDLLLQQLERMAEDGLLKEKHRKLLLFNDSIEMLLDQMENYNAPDVKEWLREDNL